jgi:beta-1,4-mannosyltransferase
MSSTIEFYRQHDGRYCTKKMTTNKDRVYSVYVYPNISREQMGSGNPYIQELKKAIGMHALYVDAATSDKAFPDLLRNGLRSDMVIFNWLENLPLRRLGLLQTIIAMGYLRLLKARGIKIVWIKHNKISHSEKWFAVSRLIQRILNRYADHIVTHSLDIDPIDTNKLMYLPHPSNIGPEAVLLDEPEEPTIDLLIWGSLLPYKGVLEFLQFAKKDACLRLLKIHVAGKCTPEYWEQLRKFSGGNVTLDNRFIKEEELVNLFKKTRFVLFTYKKKSVMSSGVLIDSLAACRKIIAPDCGAFSDMARQHNFVQVYNEFSEISTFFRQHYNDYKLNYKEVCAFVAQNSWYNMGAKIKTLTN